MRKLGLLMSALFAVFSFGALAASAAFAEEALWLVNMMDIGEALLVEVEGTLLLIDLKTTGGPTEVECSGLFDGFIGPWGTDLVTEVLSLGGASIPNLGGATFLLCKPVRGLCEPGMEAEVQPENLPWLTTLELMTDGRILDLFSEETPGSGLPGWSVFCLVITIRQEDLCEGETSATIELDAEGLLLGFFNAEDLELEHLEAECSLGGVESGAADSPGGGWILLPNEPTAELDVSSP